MQPDGSGDLGLAPAGADCGEHERARAAPCLAALFDGALGLGDCLQLAGAVQCRSQVSGQLTHDLRLDHPRPLGARRTLYATLSACGPRAEGTRERPRGAMRHVVVTRRGIG